MMLAGVLMISCGSKNEFRIEGTLDGGAGRQIRLDLVKGNQLGTVDSTLLDDKGHFVLKGNLEQPSFGILRTPENKMIMVILHPGDHITVTGSYDDLEKNHVVEGSEDTKLFEEFRVHLQQNIDKLEAMNKTYRDSLRSPNIGEITKELRKRSMDVINEQKEYTRRFVTEHAGSLASLLALYQQIAPGMYIMDPMEDLAYYEKVDSALNVTYPASDPVITFHAQLAELRSRKRQQEEEEKILGIGKVPPEIALPDPQGDTLRLSSLRGKVVLLDFWASWCSPCRRENPNLVKTYEKYHKKGFEIFQVSLDRTKEAWMNGIKADHLDQWYHVSDLGYWQSSVVKLYHIQGIPTNYLLDKDGKIIARNLRGEALAAKLAEIFGS
jgi:thiol-disulfide isomerase/thioredoxin